MQNMQLKPVINSLQNLGPTDFIQGAELKEESAAALNTLRDSLIDVVLSANLTFIPTTG